MVSDCSAGGAEQVLDTRRVRRCHSHYADCNYRRIPAAPHTIGCDFIDEKVLVGIPSLNFSGLSNFQESVFVMVMRRMGSVGTAKTTRPHIRGAKCREGYFCRKIRSDYSASLVALSGYHPSDGPSPCWGPPVSQATSLTPAQTEATEACNLMTEWKKKIFFVWILRWTD